MNLYLHTHILSLSLTCLLPFSHTFYILVYDVITNFSFLFFFYFILFLTRGKKSGLKQKEMETNISSFLLTQSFIICWKFMRINSLDGVKLNQYTKHKVYYIICPTSTPFLPAFFFGFFGFFGFYQNHSLNRNNLV